MAEGKLSQNGIRFLFQSEGSCRYVPFWDVNGLAVGYGHHGKDVIAGKRYTQAEVDQMFVNDTVKFAKDVNKVWHEGMTQNMFDAMFSLAYNHGNVSATKLKEFCAGDGWRTNEAAIKSWWPEVYINKGSKYEQGLRKRRNREVSLFYTPDGQDIQLLDYTGSEYSSEMFATQFSMFENLFDISSSPQANSSNIELSGGENDIPTPPKIYQAFGPTIVLDELAYIKEGSATETEEEEKEVNTDPNEYGTGEDNNYEKYQSTSSRPEGIMVPGRRAPYIRIRDKYFHSSEILYFELDNTKFLPTARLKVNLEAKELARREVITEGEVMSVFFMTSMTLIKPMRCDFLITNVTLATIEKNVKRSEYIFYIDGELNIPGLRSYNMKYVFTGSARDCLVDIAMKLGIGYNYNDEDNTDGVMQWMCTPKEFETIPDFIQDTASRMWKTNLDFFDAWIDPRYALTVLNISKIIKPDGEEDGYIYDATKYINNHVLDTGTQSLNTDAGLRDGDSGVTAKLFTNLINTTQSNTPFYVRSYKLLNRAAEITKRVGLSECEKVVIGTPGVAEENTQVDTTYQLIINNDKLNSGNFYAMTGPGENFSYESGEATEQYTDSAITQFLSRVVDVFANGDENLLLATGSNDQSSGNFPRTYFQAERHNYINNMQLKKQNIILQCDGVNLGVMRGEYVPVLLLDINDPLGRVWDIQSEFDLVDTPASGWFMLAGIKWIYDVDKFVPGGQIQTLWTTELTLTRREWPIPGVAVPPPPGVKYSVNAALGKSKESNNGLENELDADGEGNEEFGTTSEGLKQYMIDLWNAIQTACNGKAVLSSGRRYALDTEGNKVEGNAFVKLGDTYKCMTSAGRVAYFKEYDSRHLYGEAMDVINGTGISMNDILEAVIKSDECLKIMYDNGVSMYGESTQDDNGLTALHWHIGTGGNKQKEFWDSVKEWIDKGLRPATINGIGNISGYAANNSKWSRLISNTIVEETLSLDAEENETL